MKPVVGESPKSEWFAECLNHNSNNALAAALAAIGLGHEGVGTNVEVLCHDNRTRSMFRIPSSYVQKIKRVMRGNDVLRFRFWKRAHHDVPAYPADFVERKGARQSSKFKSAAARLEAIKGARVAK